jgi:hypothetical protein
MTATVERLTIGGICGAILFAASQADTIFGQFEKYWGSSPYFIFAKSLKYEAALVIVVAILVYRLDVLGLWEPYSKVRSNWRGRRMSLLGLSLYTEELAALAMAAFLILSFFVHVVSKGLATYQTYGLSYIASNLCEGDFDAALERMRSIKFNPLWRKYESLIQGNIERSTYLNDVVGKRRTRFDADRDRSSVEENAAQAVELRLIFGINVRDAIENEFTKVSNNRLVQQWRTFLSNFGC